MSTDQDESHMYSGLCVLSAAGLTESETAWTPGGRNCFLCVSLLSSCFLVSGEEEQRGAKGSPQLLATEGGIKSLSRLACRLGSSCQKE